MGYGALRASKKKGPQGIDSDSQARYSAEQGMQSIEPAWLTLAMNDRASANGGTC